MKLRRTFNLLSIVLTSAALCSLSAGCGNPFNNDWRNHRLAPDASYDSTRAPGSSARDLLSGATFKSVVVQILAVHDFAPSQESINRLSSFLQEHLNKPSGVTVYVDEIPSPGKAKWTISDVMDLEDRYRTRFSEKDQLVIYYLFVDGHSADDQGMAMMMGQAYRSGSVVVYEQTLREESLKNNLNTWIVEATVMEHEFGHLMGLVNGGIPDTSQHDDLLTQHHGHCNNPKCLMYFAAETTVALSALSGGLVPDLDESCKQDLKAAGGK